MKKIIPKIIGVTIILKTLVMNCHIKVFPYLTDLKTIHKRTKIKPKYSNQVNWKNQNIITVNSAVIAISLYDSFSIFVIKI